MAYGIVACSMLEQELKQLLPADVPVVWLNGGLHEQPVQLRCKLQETLDNLPPEIDTVLLAYGFCGGGLDGISCPTATLVLPLYDDCIGMLLAEPPDPYTMYFTEGWLQDARFLGNAYARDVEKYGAKKAKAIYGIMLSHYKTLAVLNTNTFPLAPVKQRIEAVAEALNLSVKVVHGSNDVLKALLQQEDVEDFWYLPPGQCFTLDGYLQRKARKVDL